MFNNDSAFIRVDVFIMSRWLIYKKIIRKISRLDFCTFFKKNTIKTIKKTYFLYNFL